MPSSRGFRQHLSTTPSFAGDHDDDTASSHLLAELQAGEADRADDYPQVNGVDDSRYTDTYEQQPVNDKHAAERYTSASPKDEHPFIAGDEDEPPQSIMYEEDQHNEDKDPESSSTPQAFPGSMVQSQPAFKEPIEERGRRKETGTEITNSTSSIDSASPPPDLLDSGSSEPDTSTERKKAKNGLPQPVTSRTGANGSGSRHDRSSRFNKSSLRAPSSSPSPVRLANRELSAAEKGKGKIRHKGDLQPPLFGFGFASSSSRASRSRTHKSSQHGLINGDSLSESSSDDSPGDILADPSASPGSAPSRSRSRLSARSSRGKKAAWNGLDEKQKALWNWVNVVDLDGYLQEVYEYYTGKGFYCIALRKIFNLCTSAFVIIFSTFLLSCVDISKFPKDGHGQLKDVVVDQCMSSWSVPHIILTWVFIAFFGWKLVSFFISIPKLLEIKRFYEYLLDVPDVDIQTISWPEIVRRISNIRNQNPTTSLRTGAEIGDREFDVDVTAPKLDAHDVANRIMRQENYLIALFNKDLLDLRVRLPLPSFIIPFVPKSYLLSDATGKSTRQYLSFGANSLTKALEWNLRYCLLGFLFDRRGLVRKEFVRERKRKDLVERLQRRFIFIGIINAIFAPFIVLYLIMYSFFRYFEEYHKNPSSIGSRQYTPYGRWKFREFNELPHLFERRLDQSYPAAKRYIDQFPKEINALTMRFIAFIAGAFAAVLLLITVIDPVFLHFEITPNRTVLFYLGVFTSVLAVARGMVPQDNTVFEPEVLLKEVVSYTHYMPGDWEGKLHSRMVHHSFGQIFEMKITVFFQEMISVVLTPLVLWFSLPPCAENIIDFFREFTVHVEGVGYVCSFAVFDFKRHGNVKFGAPGEATRDERMQSKEGKMEKSFLHFTVTHPEWQPSDQTASIFLSKMTDQTGALSPQLRKGTSIHAHGHTDAPGPTGRDVPDSDYLRDRSQLYERALQRSIMMRSSSKPLPKRSVPKHPFQRGERLEAMKEQNEVNEAGWEAAEVPSRGGNGSDESDSAMHGRKDTLRGNGMIGLLQHVMK